MAKVSSIHRPASLYSFSLPLSLSTLDLSLVKISIQMRYTRLDGLRGLLSVIVALNHSFLILAIPASANIWGANIFIFHGLQSKLQQIFMLLGNGGLAVTIFFVLSGFVLGESFGKGRHTIKNSAVFLIRRLLRLYPVYLI